MQWYLPVDLYTIRPQYIRVSELYDLKQARVDRIFIVSRAASAPCEIGGFGRYISHCLICIQVVDHSCNYSDKLA